MNRGIKFLTLMAILLTLAVPGFCDRAEDYYKRGVSKHTKGDVDGAIAEYTKAIELNPNHAHAYHNRGFGKHTKGDLDGALVDFVKAVELMPDHDEGHYNIGNIKRVKGDLEGAITDYTRAIKVTPGYSSAYYNRGFTRQIKGDLEGAIVDYTKVIQLNPKHLGALTSRGYLNYNTHNFSNSLIDFRRVVQLTRTNDYDHYRIWLIRARLGDAKGATTDLQKFLESRIERPEEWTFQIGRYLAGQVAEPEYLAAAKHPDPKTEADQLCEAYFYAGSKHLLLGDKAKATDYFQKSIATGQKEFLEYKSAEAELKFLKAQKN